MRWQHTSQTLVTLDDLPSLDDEDDERTLRATQTFLYSERLEGPPGQEWLEVLSSEPSDMPGGNLPLLRVRN